MLALQLMFAGAWAFIWHWGTGIAIIVLLVLAAYFTTAIPLIGPLLKDARRDLLWAALGVAIFLAGQWLGAHDANRAHAAKQVIIEQHVDSVVEKTTTPKARKQKDRWDRPEY